MKTFVPALLVALAGVASAQLADLPQCSLQCFLTALGSDGCSELTDFKCHCEKSDSLLASVTPCVQGACTPDEVSQVIKGVENTCASAGVTIDVPEPSATAAPESSTAPESSAEPSSADPASSAEPSSTDPISYSAEPSPTEPVSSAEPSATEPAPTSSVSAVPIPSANGTIPSATPAPSSSEFPGAASRIGAAAGLIGAAALAVFAL
ncbi:hypothetical protein P171DRAFT_462077 [Karstenula rhodostoma CBS 690.94]|uniref:CFEM domain-containing protein n=1 Tax=Karstenula rhodostoma CBS 690.94 TaxID=1392251 RepID=A0A9P4PPI8_9PLEO|nr:hypothetical protein P171DRAFT_462077 [Karstenula rhodostoma CBS 690.94]